MKFLDRINLAVLRKVPRVYVRIGLYLSVGYLVCCLIGLVGIAVFGRMRFPESDYVPNTVEGTQYDSFGVSPDGRRIVFAGGGKGGKDLYLFDLATRRVMRLTDTPDYENYPAFSPDGRRVVYQAAPTLDTPRYLFIRSLDGAHVRQITRGTMTADMYPSFSPDGRRVVFARARFYPGKGNEEPLGPWDVWVVGSDGSDLKRLTHEGYHGFVRPRFFPDGRRVIFERWVETFDGDGDANIASVDAEGRGPVRDVLRNSNWSTRPTFFPDGRQIVFVSDLNRRYDYDLYRLSLDGGHPVAFRVDRYGTGFHDPSMMPDGRSILYQSGYGADLWQVDVDGSHAHKVADDSLFSNPLHWKQ